MVWTKLLWWLARSWVSGLTGGQPQLNWIHLFLNQIVLYWYHLCLLLWEDVIWAYINRYYVYMWICIFRISHVLASFPFQTRRKDIKGGKRNLFVTWSALPSFPLLLWSSLRLMILFWFKSSPLHLLLSYSSLIWLVCHYCCGSGLILSDDEAIVIRSGPSPMLRPWWPWLPFYDKSLMPCLFSHHKMLSPILLSLTVVVSAKASLKHTCLVHLKEDWWDLGPENWH